MSMLIKRHVSMFRWDAKSDETDLDKMFATTEIRHTVTQPLGSYLKYRLYRVYLWLSKPLEPLMDRFYYAWNADIAWKDIVDPEFDHDLPPSAKRALKDYEYEWAGNTKISVQEIPPEERKK